MPTQEVFFEAETIAGKLEILKTYDRGFAREAFDEMSDAAKQLLRSALEPEEDLQPASNGLDSDALWNEMEETAREDWNTFSYFVVRATKGSNSHLLYVSSDFPSAKRFLDTVMCQ